MLCCKLVVTGQIMSSPLMWHVLFGISYSLDMLIETIIHTYYSKVLCPQLERVSIDNHREYLETVSETIQRVSNLIQSSLHHDAYQSPEWISSLSRINDQIPIYLTPILSEVIIKFVCYLDFSQSFFMLLS